MADREFPGVGVETHQCSVNVNVVRSKTAEVVCTVELGLGEDAAAEAEPVFPVADVEGRHRRMVRHLGREGFYPQGNFDVAIHFLPVDPKMVHLTKESCKFNISFQPLLHVIY